MNVLCDNSSKTQDVFSRVKKVITAVLKISDEKITMESSYIGDFGANSLELVSLIVQFEFEFGEEIPEEDARGLTTVGATVQYILKHM